MAQGAPSSQAAGQTIAALAASAEIDPRLSGGGQSGIGGAQTPSHVAPQPPELCGGGGGVTVEGHATPSPPEAATCDTPQEVVYGCDADPEQVPTDRLFESARHTRPDANLVRRAIRGGWTEVSRTVEVLDKLQKQALGEEGPHTFTPPQLVAAANTLLTADRMVQIDDHHGDRVGIARESLHLRRKVGSSDRGTSVSVTGLGNDGSGPSVQIYIPHNGRDDPGDLAIDVPVESLRGDS